MSKVLKAYMKQHFDFSGMKQSGVYPKEMKHTDYEGQAKIVCKMLGLDSIYDYNKYEIRCHISLVSPDDKSGLSSYVPPMTIDEKGKLDVPPFVTVINENPMHL